MNRVVNSASLTNCWRQHLSNWVSLGVLLGAIFIHGLSAFAQQLETLSVGRQTYRNVSIQNKTASHVFLQHDDGLAVIKLRDLPMSVMQQLGLAPVTIEQQKELKRMQAGTNQLSQMIPIKVPPQLVEQSLAFAKPFQAEFETRIRPVVEKSLPLVITGLVLTHLLFSFCFMLICQKAKYPAGLAIWIPIIQIFPLMGAAKMSKWLVLLLILPVINVVVSLVWCIKICQALNKSALLGVLLFLPVINILVLFYLAFSAEHEYGDRPVVKLDFAQSASE